MTKLIKFFNLEEKIASLKILILIISSDYSIDSKDKKLLARFVKESGLKLTQPFYDKTLSENIDDILKVFTSKENYESLEKLCIHFSKNIEIDPDIHGDFLSKLYAKIEIKKHSFKTNFGTKLKNLFKEFGFLWGKNEISPKNKLVLALFFTILACVIGSFWTYRKFWGLGREDTIFVLPQLSAVISGLLIHSALAFRKYLPSPISFRTIIFFIFNVYLLSIIAMYILGRSGIEKTTTVFIFFSLITLLWFGIKELLGFFFLGLFILFTFKVVLIDIHMGWRAFPFIILAFMGISFQSNNFFNDFISFTSSFNKTPEIDKKIVRNNIDSIADITPETNTFLVDNLPDLDISELIT